MMKNREVAQIFADVAEMLSIRGDQIHRILAYRRAAESIAELGRDINQIAAEGYADGDSRHWQNAGR